MMTKPFNGRRLNINIYLICLIFFFLNSKILFSQSTPFQNFLKEAAVDIQDVTTKQNKIEQFIEVDKEKLYRVSFTSIRIDKKGKKSENKYKFNLTDIASHSVKWEAKKDLIEVNLKINGRQKMIQHFKNGELQNYISQIKILATDADNGRKIEELFKEIIPVAIKKVVDPLAVLDLSNQKKWLMEKVTNVTVDGKNYKQSWEFQEEDQRKILFTVNREERKKSSDKRFDFNLVDFNKEGVNMKIKGKKVFVELNTINKQKLIGVKKNEMVENYSNRIQIYAEQPDFARDLVKVLQKFIPTINKESVDNWTPPNELTTQMEWLTNRINISLNKYDQSFKILEAPCKCQLLRTKNSGKKVNEKKWEFNLSNIDLERLQFKIEGKDVFVQINSMHKEKIIKSYKNGETSNYLNEVIILEENIETARQLIKVMAAVIKNCNQ